jgi:hypothetical protein
LMRGVITSCVFIYNLTGSWEFLRILGILT